MNGILKENKSKKERDQQKEKQSTEKTLWLRQIYITW